MHKQGDFLSQRFGGDELLSSPTRDILRSHIKGSQIQSQIGSQALHDLAEVEAAQRARRRRERSSNRPLQVGGRLYAHEAREQAVQLDLTESEKAAALLFQERLKARKRWKLYVKKNRDKVCIGARGRGADKAVLRSTPWGRLLHPPSSEQSTYLKHEESQQYYLAIDRSRQWRSYYPKEDIACLQPRLVATKSIRFRVDNKTGNPERPTVRTTPPWLSSLKPDFLLAIGGYTERSSDSDWLLVNKLIYDHARNHLDDREQSDEEERLYKQELAEGDWQTNLEPTGTQSLSQINQQSQSGAGSKFEFDFDDIEAVFNTQF